MQLSDTAIRAAKAGSKPVKLFDGGGLFLLISPTGGKLWRLKYRFGGKEKLLSLGQYPAVSLKDARKRRDEAKEQIAAGIDPSAKRRAIKVEQIKAEGDLFKSVALEWYRSYSPSITPLHAEKLMRYLEKDLFPALGHKLVSEIEPSEVLLCARPAEARDAIDTAHRLVRLVSQVMRHAVLTGRCKFNPAAGLSKALRPNRPQSYAAITEPRAIAGLLMNIENYDGFPSIRMFLKILPYVFTRPSELRLAEWDEIDVVGATWRIPAKRMKMRREHVVPLSRQVLTMLEQLRETSYPSKLLFPSTRSNTRTISDVGPLAALRLMGYSKEQMTLHGFRAMASTRLNEMGYRADVIEAQLAHKEQDAVRLAYNRAEYMGERRKMMQKWSDYLDGLIASVK